METQMATATLKSSTPNGPKYDQAVEEKIQQIRQLYADAPTLARTALERGLDARRSDLLASPPPPVESAGRIGSRLGNVSELTIVVPLVPGGAKRVRALLHTRDCNPQ